MSPVSGLSFGVVQKGLWGRTLRFEKALVAELKTIYPTRSVGHFCADSLFNMPGVFGKRLLGFLGELEVLRLKIRAQPRSSGPNSPMQSRPPTSSQP